MAEYSAVLYKRLGTNHEPNFSRESKRPLYANEANFDSLMKACFEMLYYDEKVWPKYHIIVEKDDKVFGAVKYIKGTGVFFEKNVRPWGQWLIKPDGSRGKKIQVDSY